MKAQLALVYRANLTAQSEPIAMVERFFVYILANCSRGVLYVGVTGNLAGRVTVHKAKLASGFTKTHGVVLLVYYEEYASVIEARARERAVKRWRRDWKLALVEKANPAWRDLAEEIAS